MKVDEYGRYSISEQDALIAIYRNPKIDFSKFYFRDPNVVEKYNNSVKSTYSDYEFVKLLEHIEDDPVTWHKKNQQNLYMPDEYKNFDIAQYVIDKCSCDTELQRVGEELLEFQDRGLFPLLCYLKYLVDLMREHKILWGVGRGSSTSSFVLYLIGIHKINSIYYDLPFNEFMR